MKLYIFKKEKWGPNEARWWYNFRQSIDTHAWPGAELKRIYNAELVTSTRGKPHIKFNSKADATFFLLKHS